LPSPEGTILDPDNLYHRYFHPILTKAGLRKIRLHDLRHPFGWLLIQSGASLGYVKEQTGHSSIQVTVDTYGQLIPGAHVSFVDRLDGVAEPKAETSWQQSATPAQLDEVRETAVSPEVADLIGGGGRTRTYDLRIMSHPTGADSKQLQQDTSADSGKVLQNPHHPRTKKNGQL
jgi:hypothetical protein